jgi:hypothetical protein
LRYIFNISVSPKQIALTPRRQRRVAVLAEQAGQPWQVVLDKALAAYRSSGKAVRRESGESFFDADTRHDLTGRVPGGPPGLSANPVHPILACALNFEPVQKGFSRHNSGVQRQLERITKFGTIELPEETELGSAGKQPDMG